MLVTKKLKFVAGPPELLLELLELPEPLELPELLELPEPLELPEVLELLDVSPPEDEVVTSEPPVPRLISVSLPQPVTKASALQAAIEMTIRGKSMTNSFR